MWYVLVSVWLVEDVMGNGVVRFRNGVLGG